MGVFSVVSWQGRLGRSRPRRKSLVQGSPACAARASLNLPLGPRVAEWQTLGT